MCVAEKKSPIYGCNPLKKIPCEISFQTVSSSPKNPLNIHFSFSTSFKKKKKKKNCVYSLNSPKTSTPTFQSQYGIHPISNYHASKEIPYSKYQSQCYHAHLPYLPFSKRCLWITHENPPLNCAWWRLQGWWKVHPARFYLQKNSMVHVSY